jgi:uncharacterized protein (TIGR03382 family)
VRLLAASCLSSLVWAAPTASAQLWTDVTAETIGDTLEWTSKLELADVDGDGRVDLLFANGGNYNEPGLPEPNRVFLNRGPGAPFEEMTLGTPDLSRVIKVGDVDGDGDPDIVVGGAYQSQTRLFLGDGAGGFDEVTTDRLPARVASVGDLELGDVDGDGDLDMVLADWGPGDPFETDGAPMILWLNDGAGRFTDASDRLPAKSIAWSWDFELLDVDNDYDLDILVSCKVCTGGSLFHNRGDGSFEDASDLLPQFTNNYEFEAADFDGDGFLDVVTINDGDQVDPENQFDKRERIFTGDGAGGFVDATAAMWPDSENLGADDNAVVILDFDSDGDSDFLIASLGDAPDRLMVNDGGTLRQRDDTFDGVATPGTLGIGVADLDGDGKLDVVQSQGELADAERVYFGAEIAADTAAPRIDRLEQVAAGDQVRVRVRVHDGKTPVAAHDFSEIALESGGESTPLRWSGGRLWQARVDLAEGQAYRVCATDAAGNRACSEELSASEDDKADDVDPGAGGCSAGGHRGSGLAMVLMLAAIAANRRRRR